MITPASNRLNRLTTLATALLLISCSGPGVLTPREFTAEFVQALRSGSSTLEVRVIEDLRLQIKSPNSVESTAYLDNAYDAYRKDPARKAEVLQHYVAGVIETMNRGSAKADPAHIVPVIKDRAWMEETTKAVLAQGAAKAPEYYFETFNDELVVIYGEDRPENVVYLSTARIAELKIDHAELRRLACANLQRILPPVERVPMDGMISIEGADSYQSSLLLLDSLWTDGRLGVRGEIVVGVPSRSVLLVAGSQDPSGLARLREHVEEVYRTDTYRLTRKLFVYRNGRFVTFSG
jgi:uncharacterized protein YtpQ (UPF0354 family)